MLGITLVAFTVAALAYLGWELAKAERCACGRPGCGGGCGSV